MKDYPVGEADADLTDSHRLRRGLLWHFDEAGGKSSILSSLLAGIGAGAVLTGNPIEERLEDAFAGEVSNHTVVVLTIDKSADKVCLYDPACGPMPLTVELDRFIDAWNDSGNFALIVQP